MKDKNNYPTKLILGLCRGVGSNLIALGIGLVMFGMIYHIAIEGPALQKAFKGQGGIDTLYFFIMLPLWITLFGAILATLGYHEDLRSVGKLIFILPLLITFVALIIPVAIEIIRGLSSLNLLKPWGYLLEVIALVLLYLIYIALIKFARSKQNMTKGTDSF